MTNFRWEEDFRGLGGFMNCYVGKQKVAFAGGSGGGWLIIIYNDGREIRRGNVRVEIGNEVAQVRGIVEAFLRDGKEFDEAGRMEQFVQQHNAGNADAIGDAIGEIGGGGIW